MHPDSAREVKARLLAVLRSLPSAQRTGAPARRGWVAVGLAPIGRGAVRVAVRLADPADRAMLPDLGRAAEAEVDVRVIGPVHALASTDPGDLQGRVRPLRPGISVAQPAVTAGTLGGFVRVGGQLAIVSNTHVLAASDAAAIGDAVLQPGPADGGRTDDRVAALTV